MRFASHCGLFINKLLSDSKCGVKKLLNSVDKQRDQAKSPKCDLDHLTPNGAGFKLLLVDFEIEIQFHFQNGFSGDWENLPCHPGV
jgi:hypothetical protein